MEFLKNCTTGVDLVPGFASVHYWVYTVESLSDASKLVEDRSLEDALFEAEIVVRDRRHIVYHDVPRKALWFFAGATGASDALFMHPPELDNGSTGIERHGWVFKIIFSGMFKASELSIYSSRLAATFSPVPSGQSPTPAGMLSAAANARGFQHNTASSGGAPANSAIGFPYDRNDIRSIHSFFIQGVQACFAYTLAKGGKALQLDARTFVTAPEPDDDLSSNRESQSLSVFTIDHSLANGGGMLVSTSIRNDTRLSSYVECVVDMEDHAEIVIAPGGLFASVIHGHRTAEDNDIRKWKAYVRDSLRGRGIDLAMLDPQNRWLLLKLRDQSDVNDIYATSSTVFYWPMVLCFSCQSFVVPTDDPHEDEPTDLYWVRPTDADGYTEPLRFAQEWYNGKTNRDNVVEERGRILDLAKKQAENAILTVTTPAYTRDGLQATAGVYPTPPDGVLSQVSHAQTLDVPAVSLPVDQAAYRSGLDMQHSDMMDLDMGPFEDNVRQGPSVISRGSLDAVMKMDGDDLFGDLEDEDLRGQDITDADFSFFDEPEIPDEEMMDNIIEDPGDGSITKMEDDKPTADRTGSKELTVNVQGLLNATATEQNKNNSSILATKTRHAQTLDLIEKVKDTPMNNTDHSLQSERDHNEPLSPSSIRRKLFDFTIRPAMTGRRASQFQPLPFNALLQQHDAKYILDGSFGFKVMYPQSAGRHFATSPYIKPRPPDVQGRRRSIQPRKSITFPGQTGLYDGDSSSDASISSDDESVYGNGAPSFVTSPVKGKFPTGNESTGDDAQSVPGTNLLIGEDFNLDVNVSA
jgi:mediator of RNA polymerase II transcription subunit 13